MWSRKHAFENCPPIGTWAGVTSENLTKSQRELLEKRVEAMKLYAKLTPVKEIAKITGITKEVLPALARKCLKLAYDGQIYGFRALLPYTRFERYVRTAPLKRKLPDQQGGYSGALGWFLERFPDAEPMLTKMILQEKKRNEVHEHQLRSRDLHRLFIAFAKEKGVTETEWPFTTKFRGSRTIARFMKDLLDRRFSKAVLARGDSAARAHLAVGGGEERLLSFTEPYDCVEIDAYKIEAHMTVQMETPEGAYVDILLERIWLIAAVERLSTALLAYAVVYRSEVTADDVVRVIRDAATGRWSPMELTLPLTYPPQGGLPSGVIEAAYGAQWSVTMLDGALAHLALAVHEKARKALGFAINWGPVGHFERRPNVEGFFKRVAEQLFKRLPSTTGSNPQNGRAQDAEKKAVQYRIRASDVEQVLDVTAALMNITPGGAFNMAPLDTLRCLLEDARQPTLIRKLPEYMREHAKTLLVRETAVVRGGRDSGRRPYIQVDRVHYTNEVLKSAGRLVGQTLTIEIDEEDMRQVKAFLPSGAELGVLRAQGKWGKTRHSRKTRKAINSLLNRRVIVLSEFDDPLQVYLRHLSQLGKGKQITPKNATEIARVSKEIGVKPKIHSARTTKPKPTVASPPTSTPERSLLSAVGLGDTDKFFDKVKNHR